MKRALRGIGAVLWWAGTVLTWLGSCAHDPPPAQVAAAVVKSAVVTGKTSGTARVRKPSGETWDLTWLESVTSDERIRADVVVKPQRRWLPYAVGAGVGVFVFAGVIWGRPRLQRRRAPL